MGYSIYIVRKGTENKKEPEVLRLAKSAMIQSSNVPCEYVNGQFRQIGETEAHVSITYNYSSYFYEVTEGDDRFLVDDGNGGLKNGGIRGLYGKGIIEGIGMIASMVSRIYDLYMPDGEWKTGKRHKVAYFSAGREVSVMDYIKNSEQCEKVETDYIVSEGDTSDYWETTAANAIKALTNLTKIIALTPMNVEGVIIGD